MATKKEHSAAEKQHEELKGQELLQDIVRQELYLMEIMKRFHYHYSWTKDFR